MAEYGLNIVNNSGQLTLSSNSPGYRYIGVASLYSSAVKTFNTSSTTDPDGYGDISVWEFQFQMPNATDIPFFAMEVHSGIVVPGYSYHAGGGLWRFSCHSVQVSSYPTLGDFTSIQVVQPSVYVFGPYTAPSAGEYGLALLTPDNKTAFNSSQRPMVYKTIVNSVAASYGYTGGGSGAFFSSDGSSASVLYSEGKDIAANPAARPLIITGASGGGTAIKESSGEDIFVDEWGWSLQSGRLKMRRFITQRYIRSPFDVLYDTYQTDLYGGPALILEGNDY